MRNWRWLIFAVTLLPVLGCVTPPPAQPPEPPPAPPPVKRELTEVVIFASEDIPAYSRVAKQLARQLGQRAGIRYLGERQLDNLKALEPYRNDEKKQFVSIGLGATVVAAKAMPDRQLVFCQVFNYREHGLISPKHKGVSMIASLSRTFAAWHALSPGITDVGVLTGPNMEDVLQAATAEAKANGITLHAVEVASDKEFQYEYKSLATKVQGYWLLPDNRVLSENALREVMSFSVLNSKQVVVFSDELLSLGGLMSVTSDYRDIARQVLARLEAADGRDTIPGPEIIYPAKAILRINPVMAQRLNLAIPKHFKKYVKNP